jgi:hypothetical protein
MNLHTASPDVCDLRTLFGNDGGVDRGFFGLASSTPFDSITLVALAPASPATTPSPWTTWHWPRQCLSLARSRSSRWASLAWESGSDVNGPVLNLCSLVPRCLLWLAVTVRHERRRRGRQ